VIVVVVIIIVVMVVVVEIVVVKRIRLRKQCMQLGITRVRSCESFDTILAR
jgi:uncharacterized membrane protein